MPSDFIISRRLLKKNFGDDLCTPPRKDWWYLYTAPSQASKLCTELHGAPDLASGCVFHKCYFSRLSGFDFVGSSSAFCYAVNPYRGNVGAGVKLSPSAVFAENRLVSNGMRQLFLWHCNRPIGLSEARVYLLPVLRGWFGSNVHMTGFATTFVRLWSKDKKTSQMWYLWKL